jgi:hypothetical protein
MNVEPSSHMSGDNAVRVVLDGQPVPVPAERRSINAIRCYLETLALERQRVLFTFTVDGEPAKIAAHDGKNVSGIRVEGESVDLTEMPLRLIETAMQQTRDARTEVESAVSVVLINVGRPAQELWWNLTRKLKDPLLTLCLLPEGLFGPVNGAASPLQLRRWQLQQLAAIIRDVDAACWSSDPVALSNALENRVLPWLEALQQSITLLHDTTLAGTRSATARREQGEGVAT